MEDITEIDPINNLIKWMLVVEWMVFGQNHQTRVSIGVREVQLNGVRVTERFLRFTSNGIYSICLVMNDVLPGEPLFLEITSNLQMVVVLVLCQEMMGESV